MIPTSISKRVVVDRLNWVEQMIGAIRKLPLADREKFFLDSRNIHTAESCLRRSLEALLDLGRHILAKGFGIGVTEYREVSLLMEERGVLSHDDADLLGILSGYRNRLVHFYHEVDAEELYNICVSQLTDVEHIADELRKWMREHPQQIDEQL
jgi:uncharacterized protein YutE (UPF0331/DUF86 family)